MTRRSALAHFALAPFLLTTHGGQQPADIAGRTSPRAGWYRRASAVLRVALTAGRRYPQLAIGGQHLRMQLAEIRKGGISAIEIFAPSYGGHSFNGLDTKDYFTIDPRIGDMEQFRRVVATAHEQDICVTIFTNLGYCSVNAPFFLKACDDVRQGRDSRGARWFFWSDSDNTPAPGRSNSYFLLRPNLPGYNARKSEVWTWSERAGRFYWSKWPGVDDSGRTVRLPQYNWGDPGWQQEAKRIVEFWMSTGIDGMVVDAVNWYVNITWALVRTCITDVIRSHGSGYAQPEGGGGFRENPVAWITDGGFNSVTDYGLGIWWEKTNAIRTAIESGDPRPIEAALRQYHDPVSAAGGVLCFPPPRFEDPARSVLALALTAYLGDIVLLERADALNLDDQSRRILNTKLAYAALQQPALRQTLHTSNDANCYAIVRTPGGRNERVLCAFNFEPASQQLKVDVSGLLESELRDLESDQRVSWENPLPIDLPAFGFRCLSLSNPSDFPLGVESK